MLLSLDKIVLSEPGRRLIATKAFPASEEFFGDHFPGFPVVPGTMLMELMVESASWLIAATTDFAVWPLLERVEKIKMRHFVGPDQSLRVLTELRAQGYNEWSARSQVSLNNKDDKKVTEAVLFFRSNGPGELKGRRQLREAFRTLTGVGGMRVESKSRN